MEIFFKIFFSLSYTDLKIYFTIINVKTPSYIINTDNEHPRFQVVQSMSFKYVVISQMLK